MARKAIPYGQPTLTRNRFGFRETGVADTEFQWWFEAEAKILAEQEPELPWLVSDIVADN
jgi:hypothetical protein